jgi:hypothetical protein
MGHILKPYKGGRDDHKDQAADQKKAAFEWAEISKLLDKYQLWPAKWTSIIKTAIGQKTLGRDKSGKIILTGHHKAKISKGPLGSLPPSLPPEEQVCVSACLPGISFVSLSPSVFFLSLRERERASERAIDRV